jgi:hypothetical protein
VIWGDVQSDLPPLKAAVEAMLEQLDRNPSKDRHSLSKRAGRLRAWANPRGSPV